MHFTERCLKNFYSKQLETCISRLQGTMLEIIFARFVSKNGLILDPNLVKKERAVINPRTSEEIELFVQMLTTFGMCQRHKSYSFRDVDKLLTFGRNISPPVIT